eukprot:c22967_g1_i1 orf=99-1223(+)
MSRSLLQPIGQKRLTNVAVVRLKKHGFRFEIACYKNKVLSWRSGVEKDIDEVLQSHTVYANVSKGVLAKSLELVKAFGTDDEEKICLEILEKGELQVAGKEREALLSNQFRDIATIVMEKTINPNTERPYTISMIERLMRDVHFAVEPHTSSKKQALELIRELERQFPIIRARMRLQLVVPIKEGPNLINKLKSWSAFIEQPLETNSSFSVICQVEPGCFRECDALVRDLYGRLEMLSMAVQKEGDGTMDEYSTGTDELPSGSFCEPVGERAGNIEQDEMFHQMDLASLSISGHTSSVSSGNSTLIGEGKKQQKCNTCDATLAGAKQYREHFKSDWHKHNLKRKLKQLPPLSMEECLLDTDIIEEANDLDDYCH